ncbi:MAG: hypothetical protein K8F30_13705 [Taibaiella sp.]|nr:hypothetical protein [Taibaiella sp.]
MWLYSFPSVAAKNEASLNGLPSGQSHVTLLAVRKIATFVSAFTDTMSQRRKKERLGTGSGGQMQ